MSSLVKRIVNGDFTLIAEIGVNYYDIAEQQGISPLEAAKLMCDKAKEAGIHAVKFQSYKADSLAASNSPSYWDLREEPATSQRELFARYDSFGEPEYQEIAEYCNTIGIEFCSTAFDFESADYLDPLMSVFKISSSDLTNLPFIEYQASKGKPIILSVGAGDLSEIKRAVTVVREVNDEPLVLCHCVLEYPTPYEDANLSRIAQLKKEFPSEIIGYSDHCKADKCCDVIKTAYCQGASVVEKHFTLDKALKGNDHYHAMNPDDARHILDDIAFLQTLLGTPELVALNTESAARKNARRSIVSSRNIRKGETITSDMLTFKRPGTGISPAEANLVIGSIAVKDIEDDTIIMPSMITC